jgi:hypothetical protein
MLGLALALAAACSGDSPSEPEDPRNRFDAAQVSANVATIERVAAVPILDAWAHLANHLGPSARTSPAQAPRSSNAATRLVSTIRRLASITGADRGVFLVPVIRPAVFGRTYVYDATAGQYVADPDRTGAPANGVRFVLYETDDTGAIMPDLEIGYADLIDEKAASTSSAGLRFKVVSGTTTVLDYAFEVGGLFVSPSIEIDGYISDGTDRVNFEISTQGPAWENGGPFELEAELSVPSTGFTVSAALSQAGFPDPVTGVELTIESGSDKLELSASTAMGQIDASVTVNGAMFATVQGPVANPTIAGEGGRALTQEEWSALAKVVEFTNGVFALLGGLLAPAGVLLAIALGLYP